MENLIEKIIPISDKTDNIIINIHKKIKGNGNELQEVDLSLGTIINEDTETEKLETEKKLIKTVGVRSNLKNFFTQKKKKKIYCVDHKIFTYFGFVLTFAMCVFGAVFQISKKFDLVDDIIYSSIFCVLYFIAEFFIFVGILIQIFVHRLDFFFKRFFFISLSVVFKIFHNFL
jgi:hypothetical protein